MFDNTALFRRNLCQGSVCAFLEAALCQAGLKVGRYSSPTLYDYRERIQVNGKYIEKQALADSLSLFLPMQKNLYLLF